MVHVGFHSNNAIFNQIVHVGWTCFDFPNLCADCVLFTADDAVNASHNDGGHVVFIKGASPHSTAGYISSRSFQQRASRGNRINCQARHHIVKQSVCLECQTPKSHTRSVIDALLAVLSVHVLVQ